MECWSRWPNWPSWAGATSSLSLVGVAAVLALGCEPEAAPNTGGVVLEEHILPDGRSCGRGVAVGMTDYASTNIGILALDGQVLAGSLISSGTADAQLTAALGGDVVFSRSKMGDELVLLDRFPNSILTLVDVESGAPTLQIDVGQGFVSNPHDYLDLGAGRALVTRYDRNPTPGDASFDEGDDLIVVDTTSGDIESRINLSDAIPEGFLAHPSRMARVGDRIFVTLSGHNDSFGDAAPGTLIVLSAETLAVLDVVPLQGMKNCTGLSVSPSEREIAVLCSGLIGDSTLDRPPFAGFVRLASDTLEEISRGEAADDALGPPAFSIDYVSDALLVTSYHGALEGPDAPRADTVVLHDLKSGKLSVLVHSAETPFTLGDALCVSACGLCFIADAGRGVVHRLEFNARGVEMQSEITVETAIGLPPRVLGLL